MSKAQEVDEPDEGLLSNTHCTVCGKKIEVMAFMNTGVCCELHRKDRDNDHGPARVGYTSAN